MSPFSRSAALHQKNISLGFFLAIVGTLMFSLKSAFIKFLYLQGLNADSVITLRMAFSLPIFISILIWKLRDPAKKSKLNPHILGSIFLLGFLGYFLAALFDLMGLELITAQLERLTLFTYPFMVAILGAIFFNEPVTRRIIFALIIAYSGILIVMLQELQITGNNVTRGVMFVSISALSFSFYVLLSKPLIKRLGSVLFTSLAMISSCIFGLIYGAVTIDWSLFEMTQTAWLWLSLLVIVSTVIPSFMMAEAIHRIGPTQTGVVGMLGPVFTIATAIYWLNEPFTATIAVGVCLVMAGVMSLMLGNKKPAAKPAISETNTPAP